MASNHLPWFPFFVADWMGSECVTLMSLSGRGAYIQLLCHQWSNGSLPEDTERLARMVGVSVKDFEPLWDELAELLPLCPDGRRRNSRLHEERLKQEARYEKQALNGKKGGRPPKKPKETQRKPMGLISDNPNESHTDTDTDINTTDVVLAADVPPAPTPYEVAESVITKAHAECGFPPPVPADVRRFLRPDSHVQVLAAQFGVDGAAALFVWAYRNWDKKPTWASVCAQRNQVHENMTGKTSGAGNTGKLSHLEISREDRLKEIMGEVDGAA